MAVSSVFVRRLAIVATLVIAVALSACSNGETAVPDLAATPTGSPPATATLEPEPTSTAGRVKTPAQENPSGAQTTAAATHCRTE